MNRLADTLAKQADKEDQALRDLLSFNTRKHRRRRKLSQFSLAAKADLSTNFVADIEAGNTWVSSLTLIKLAKALEIEVYELLKPDKTDGPPNIEEEESRLRGIIDRFSLDLTEVMRDAVGKAVDHGG